MKKQDSVTLCGETLAAPLHICAFFDSREEQYEVLLPWWKEGIDNNEEVLTILASDFHEDHCARMSDAGIPVQNALTNKQLKVVATGFLSSWGCFRGRANVQHICTGSNRCANWTLR